MRAARGPLASFAALGVLWGCLAVQLPALKAMVGASDALLGGLLFLTSTGAVGAMLLAPRAGHLLGGAAVPVATVATALAFMAPGNLPVLAPFAVAMLLIGATSGLLDVLMNARVSAIEAARDLPLMNLCHALYSFAYAGSAVLTGLARAAGWGPAGPLMLAGGVALLLAVAAVERGARIERLGPRRPGAAGPGAVALWAGGIILVGFFAENATEGWAALHVERTLGGGPAQGALGPALLGLTMGAGRMAGQLVATRLAEARLLRGALLVALAGAGLVALAPGPGLAYLGFAVLGLGVSVVAPTAFAMVGRLAPEGQRAAAVARAALLGYMGFFIGPPMLGLVAEAAGLRAAFGMVALALMAGLALRAGLARRDPAA
ncbi:MFS transporter [Rhodobacteraceae bacterium WD3A24]|nr:MFS transporter [Rhodobacteraceae bacterium WD3A24]